MYHNLSVTGIGTVNPPSGVFTSWAEPERATTREQLASLVFVRNCLHSNTILINLFSWVTLQNYIFNMSVCVPKQRNSTILKYINDSNIVQSSQTEKKRIKNRFMRINKGIIKHYNKDLKSTL